jgi:hypothetical protein
MEPTTIHLKGAFNPAGPNLINQNPPAPAFFIVPANKLLTIESFSAYYWLPKEQTAHFQLVASTPDPKFDVTPPWHYQIPFYQLATINPSSSNPSAELRDIWVMNHALRAYINPGWQLKLSGDRGNFRHGTGEVDLIISGFYENIS